MTLRRKLARLVFGISLATGLGLIAQEAWAIQTCCAACGVCICDCISCYVCGPCCVAGSACGHCYIP